MDDKEKQEKTKYEQAVIQLIQTYGVRIGEFGRASLGSPRGMEVTMRRAHEAAVDILWAALGREPTVEELAQVPPLYDLPVAAIPLSQLVPSPKAARPRRKRPPKQ